MFRILDTRDARVWEPDISDIPSYSPGRHHTVCGRGRGGALYAFAWDLPYQYKIINVLTVTSLLLFDKTHNLHPILNHNSPAAKSNFLAAELRC